jgi:hypothetical protein
MNSSKGKQPVLSEMLNHEAFKLSQTNESAEAAVRLQLSIVGLDSLYVGCVETLQPQKRLLTGLRQRGLAGMEENVVPTARGDPLSSSSPIS